jgi:hypothetical protein
MKKNLIYSLAVIAALGFSSCLKDKGFEDQQYGIKNPDQDKIITAPWATQDITSIAVNFVDH